MTAKRAHVVSGMRPTGKLHLGHLVGALGNWVGLQDKYDCFYFVADWHALTSEYADPSQLASHAYDNLADWIAAGIDPERSTLFIQSQVPEHAELALLLSMIIPIPWLERVPTFKEQQENIKDRDLATHGFLGYPLLQTADVIMYDAQFVPVGDDQVAHLDSHVNRSPQQPRKVFLEPQPHLTRVSPCGTRQPQDEQELGNPLPSDSGAVKRRSALSRPQAGAGRRAGTVEGPVFITDAFKAITRKSRI